jgi:hypothetical protein
VKNLLLVFVVLVSNAAFASIGYKCDDSPNDEVAKAKNRHYHIEVLFNNENAFYAGSIKLKPEARMPVQGLGENVATTSYSPGAVKFAAVDGKSWLEVKAKNAQGEIGATAQFHWFGEDIPMKLTCEEINFPLEMRPRYHEDLSPRAE